MLEHKTGIIDFYKKRFIRISPLYYIGLFVLISYCVGCLLETIQGKMTAKLIRLSRARIDEMIDEHRS